MYRQMFRQLCQRWCMFRRTVCAMWHRRWLWWSTHLRRILALSIAAATWTGHEHVHASTDTVHTNANAVYARTTWFYDRSSNAYGLFKIVYFYSISFFGMLTAANTVTYSVYRTHSSTFQLCLWSLPWSNTIVQHSKWILCWLVRKSFYFWIHLLLIDCLFIWKIVYKILIVLLNNIVQIQEIVFNAQVKKKKKNWVSLIVLSFCFILRQLLLHNN